MKRIYQTSGITGFYKGITASYFGILEIVIHIGIYEAIKRKIAIFTEHIRLMEKPQDIL